MGAGERIVVVMPAYNAERTISDVFRQLPRGMLERVIVVDDGSIDDTVAVARGLDLQLVLHERNRGYGASQKTCYRAALDAGATIVVMAHPDGQHDARLVPDLVAPILDGRADVVLGSRFMGRSPIAQGMPRWRYAGNRVLTWAENAVLGLQLSEFHSGFRAFRREVLDSVPFQLNSDRFLFDQEILAQAAVNGFRIAEVPVPTHYAPDSSSASLPESLRYGCGVIWMLARHRAHCSGILAQRWLRRAEVEKLSPRTGVPENP
jgi:glycosyltransferase involved in cell wall biosynthesis